LNLHNRDDPAPVMTGGSSLLGEFALQHCWRCENGPARWSTLPIKVLKDQRKPLMLECW